MPDSIEPGRDDEASPSYAGWHAILACFLIVHQIALLEAKIGRSGAGFAGALTRSMAVIGRLCLGMVADRFNPRALTSASLVSQALALLSITPTESAPVLFASCTLLGFSVGNLVALPPMIIHRESEALGFAVPEMQAYPHMPVVSSAMPPRSR